MAQNLPNFNLPWNDKENYWICVALPENDSLGALEKEFIGMGHSGVYLNQTCYALPAPKQWNETWNDLKSAIMRLSHNNPKIAVIGSNSKPGYDEVSVNLESVEKIDAIARNLWLGDAILEGRVECHLQPIMDRAWQVFGYESFVRLKLDDGSFVSGGKIIEAARETGIHHLLDKYLHILAIKTFAEAQLPGCLFINFITGFIQLPAKYLEGLAEAARSYGIIPKRIVLDISESQQVHDVNQIVAVINYANSKGYSVALDDITSMDTLAEILDKARPDYVKLDRAITKKAGLPQVAAEIKVLCDVLHSIGSAVIAEGVETEVVHKTMTDCDLDLFQGYYYGAPMPVSQIKLSKTA